MAAALVGVVQASPPAEAEAQAEVALTEPALVSDRVTPGYRWAPSQVAEQAPSEGALVRRFAGLAAHLSPAEGSAFSDQTQVSLDGIVARAARRADVSVHARDLRTGAVLYDHAGLDPLNPASNQKVVTAAVALELLGPDHVFETEVLRDGRDLVLRGAGDPVLDGDDLQAMAMIVAEQLELGDVERILVDDTAFDARRFGPGYRADTTPAADTPGASHEAPSGALSVDFNTLEVRIVAVAGERQPRVQVAGAGAHVVVRNDAVVGRRGGLAVRTYAEGDKTVVHVRGSMSRNARPQLVRRRVTDPGLHAGTVFAERLAEQWQAEALPVERGRAAAGAESLVVNDSAPLDEVLDRGLAYSNNLIAEQVLRAMAGYVFDEPGSWRAGVDIVEAYWRGLGRDDGAVFENGSGLSRRGRLTTRGVVDVLVAAAAETPSLLDALPGPGEPGTLRGRLGRARGRVRAKTGTLDGVSGLSGVLFDEHGQPAVAFSILVNAHDGAFMPAAARRRVEDRLVLAMLAEA